MGRFGPSLDQLAGRREDIRVVGVDAGRRHRIALLEDQSSAAVAA
jgi:hypothetical protein